MVVVGCARRQDRLDQLARELTGQSGRFLGRQCDLQSEQEVRDMFAWIEQHPDLGRVDVCINNAGLSTAETLTEVFFYLLHTSVNH